MESAQVESARESRECEGKYRVRKQRVRGKVESARASTECASRECEGKERVRKC